MRNTIKIRLPAAILIGLLLFFTACEKDEITPANLQEMTPFEVTDNTALEMVNEAVAYASIGMLFDIRKSAEVAYNYIQKSTKVDFDSPYEPAKVNSGRCGEEFTTHLTQPYSYRLLGFEGDVHVKVLCNSTWSLEGMKVSSYVQPDYTTAKTGFTAVESFGYWTIDKVAENVEAYPVSGYYIRNGIFRYGTQTHERYNYHLRIDIDEMNLLAANYDFEALFIAGFDLKVTRWSVAGEEEKDFVEGTIRFTTNGMFFVELGEPRTVPFATRPLEYSPWSSTNLKK